MDIIHKNFDYYSELAEKNKLPDNFSNFSLAGKDGYSIAHVLAANGHLPEGFKDFHLSTVDGLTVAHLHVTQYGQLPKEFDGWHWQDDQGETVAYRAAKKMVLPDNFIDFGLKNSNGYTVANCMIKYNKIPKTDVFLDTLVKYNRIIEGIFFRNLDFLIFNDIKDNIKDQLMSVFSPLKEMGLNDLIKESDDYSGFLIDYCEQTIDKFVNKFIGVECFLNEETIEDEVLSIIGDTLQLINQKKTLVKIELFDDKHNVDDKALQIDPKIDYI